MSSRSSVNPVVPTTAWMPLVDGEPDVVHHDVGMGEVDEHLRPGVGDAEQPVPGVDHRDQLQVGRRIDGPAHLLPHAAARAQHADADRFGHTRPPQTAPSKSCSPNGPTDGQATRPAEQVGGDLRDVVRRHRVDASRAARRRPSTSPYTSSLLPIRVIRDPESSRPSTMPPRIWPLPRSISASVSPPRRRRRARSRISAEHLVGLARLAPGVHAELAGRRHSRCVNEYTE